MAATKRVIVDALEQLVDKELDQFIWHLWNPIADDIIPIPRAWLQTNVRHEVVNLMVQQYSANAGNIAVRVLQIMKQNDLATNLGRRLQEVQQPEQVDGRNAPVLVRQQLAIPSDWKRPDRIIPCTQESKQRILRENKDNVYGQVDKSRRKRSALLITNTLTRPGAERDEENMEWLLTALGYRVQKHTNLSGKEIAAAVRDFAALPDHKDSDSTFVVIMSHGKRINNKDAILGARYTGPDDCFFVDEIFTRLNSVNCPALIDKPKVVLIQACRGGEPGGVNISGSDLDVFAGDGTLDSDAWVHKEKDFFCFMSTLPDIAAYRHPDLRSGSFFVMYIVQVFCESAHNTHIMDLFVKVTSGMAKHPGREENKLLPCIERTSTTNQFYLFPGL